MTIRQTQGSRVALSSMRPASSTLPAPITIFVLLLCVPGTIAIFAGSFLITPYRIYMMAITPFLFMRLFSDRSLKVSSYDFLFLAYAGWTVLCIYRNANAPGERAGMFLLQSISAYILARTSFRSIRDLRNVFSLMLTLVAIAFVLAIPEAITHKKFILDFTGDLTGVHYGQVYADGTDVRFGLRRAQAFFANPILYGLFCASILSFVWYTARSPSRRIVGAVIVAAAMSLAVSSGPLLAFNMQVVMIIIEYYTRGIKQRWMFVIGMAAVGFSLIQMGTGGGVFGLVVNYMSFNTGSAYNRVLIWNWGIINILKNPIFGREGWEHATFMKDSMDNYWIAITIQGGIPCLVFLLLGILIMMLKLGKVPDTALPKEFRAIRNAWYFSVISFLFAGFSVMFFGEIQPLFFFLLGMAGAMVPIYDREVKLSRSLAAKDFHGRVVPRRRFSEEAKV